MVFLCLAGIGIFANTPPFWALPTAVMTGTAAAGGIALVNSLGNLSGFVAPYLIGAVMSQTNNVRIALAALAILPFTSMILLLVLRQRVRAPTAS